MYTRKEYGLKLTHPKLYREIRKLKNIEATILFLNEEQAFERVNHRFLIRTLKHLNFGDHFISWEEIFLRDITSHVKINGFLVKQNWNYSRSTPRRPFKRAAVYIIIAEVLGNQLRLNRNISRITIKEIKQKVLQYADDT